MRTPIIHSDDPDLEYNMWGENYLKYRGSLFTGTLLYNDTTPPSYVEYQNGDYHGNSVTYSRNGTLIEQSTYENGNYASGTEWYDNGQLKSDAGHLYANDGKLIQKKGSWLYPNGMKRNNYEHDESNLFSSKGELAIKTILTRTANYKTTKIYYDTVLNDCYEELLINLYPDHDSFFTIPNIRFGAGWRRNSQWIVSMVWLY